MTEARLNHLMLYAHKDKTSALCMVKIAGDFVRESKYRLGVFETFVSSDLANVQGRNQPKRRFHFLTQWNLTIKVALGTAPERPKWRSDHISETNFIFFNAT